MFEDTNQTELMESSVEDLTGFESSFLEEEENNLLNAISFYIEQGHQIYSELVSNNLGISLEKLKEMLEIIKEKISSQGLVRK